MAGPFSLSTPQNDKSDIFSGRPRHSALKPPVSLGFLLHSESTTELGKPDGRWFRLGDQDHLPPLHLLAPLAIVPPGDEDPSLRFKLEVISPCPRTRVRRSDERSHPRAYTCAYM
jgi:hypothetical protein